MQYRQENILTKASRLPHTLSISCYFVFRCVSPLVCYLSVFSVFFHPRIFVSGSHAVSG